MPRGLYFLENGDVLVEHDTGARLPMSRDEYEAAEINPRYGAVMTRMDFDEWMLGKKRGEPVSVSAGELWPARRPGTAPSRAQSR
jgi:hypothetical protein